MQLVRPADNPITQDELLVWFGYRNQIAAMRTKMQALEEDLAQRLANGATVEPGPHHATIERGQHGSRRVKIR